MKKYIALSIIALLSLNLSAQKGEGQYGINYSIGLPSGKFGDFIQSNSYRGFAFDYRYNVQDKIALGLSVGWQIFGKKFEKETYEYDNGAATMVHWRYGHHVPILFQGHYTLADGDKLRLTGGLGIGPSFVREEVWLGVYTFEWTQWGFQMSPQLELQYKFNPKFGMLFSPRYNVVFGGERANFKDDKNNFQTWDFRFGVFFTM